ncbi:MAG: prepilin-type N-terminal cleavage/methylation domain-containing protein [Desulfobacterales bacterium]|nr:prepilin-type N-terminal cleavage/methylation domain-containing protein [Desulfobacterales bacterium]
MKNKLNAGFTLIEIIVCLVIISVIGASLVDFLRTSSRINTQKIVELRDSNNLKRLMETLTADYRNYCDQKIATPLDQYFTAFRLDTYKTALGITNAAISIRSKVSDPSFTIGKNDGNIELLQVTIQIGNKSLVKLLTK